MAIEVRPLLVLTAKDDKLSSYQKRNLEPYKS